MQPEVYPDVLQYTIQEFVSLEECPDKFAALSNVTIPLFEGQFCTLPPSGTSACDGDSGSGLFVAPVRFSIFYFWH